MAPVVDYARLKRLELPQEAGGLSMMTKICLFMIFMTVIFLVKRYKDIRRQPPSETF